eukprot:GHVU01037213.1.p1 GENE.GHVU01037213.1~~GHVU01037213.1.p1  ORF type:complete len:340 (-),score=54.62 GHVU01037213.1:2520-3539(-)
MNIQEYDGSRDAELNVEHEKIRKQVEAAAKRVKETLKREAATGFAAETRSLAGTSSSTSAAVVNQESGHHQRMNEYIPIHWFAGKKDGYVFKKGASGVGYYLDIISSINQVHESDCEIRHQSKAARVESGFSLLERLSNAASDSTRRAKHESSEENDGDQTAKLDSPAPQAAKTEQTEPEQVHLDMPDSSEDRENVAGEHQTDLAKGDDDPGVAAANMPGQWEEVPEAQSFLTRAAWTEPQEEPAIIDLDAPRAGNEEQSSMECGSLAMRLMTDEVINSIETVDLEARERSAFCKASLEGSANELTGPCSFKQKQFMKRKISRPGGGQRRQETDGDACA